MNVIFWNCRGVGARSFPGLIRELQYKYKVDIVLLFETRCGGMKAKKIISKMGFNGSYVVDAQGFSGGLWVLWRDESWAVSIIGSSEQCVHLSFDHNGEKCLVSAVYASPYYVKRRSLWRELEEFGNEVEGPWCVGGDFNAILFENERRSTRKEYSLVDKDFSNWYGESGLSHIHTMGSFFTWSREGCESRLDRILANDMFMDRFTEAKTTVLYSFKSDHKALLLTMEVSHCSVAFERPFRFVASWLLHNDFNEFMKRVWDKNLSWSQNVNVFTQQVEVWKTEVYGHVGRRKKQILARLDGISRSLKNQGSWSSLSQLQKELWQELETLILQEDIMWAQKARCEWFYLGDKNSKYFHRRANARRRINRIEALKGEDEEWIFDVDQIKNVAVNFYHMLFSEDRAHRDVLNVDVSYPMLTEGVISNMNIDVKEVEVETALKSMGPLKAPGPDGFNPLFFQAQWKQVSGNVIDFVRKVFENPCLIREVNQTFLVLIPKVPNPEFIRDFRPISLCNVIYKLITKIIVNRIKPVMSTIISPNQCSFVPGRLSSDNIIVAQEVIHTMKTMKGKKGFMAVKIDLEKAYDRINWEFAINCLREVGIPESLIFLIQECISSPSMQLLWNGSKSNVFNPSRGIRQGDPLSPFLFVICMEKLAHLIQSNISSGNWRPIRLNKGGPPLSHLFFADDLIIFAEARLDQVQVIKDCLNAFCDASGQKINEGKTRVFFSRNINHNIKSQLSHSLGFNMSADLGRYLGVPLHHERVSKSMYQFTVDKVKQRLASWKCHSLSLAGRNTLINSVALSIPNHVMQTSIIPVACCDEIERNARNFLWGSTSDKKKAHLVAWDKVCYPKVCGGLGLRHASLQNKAFMMKVGWGLVNNKDALWARVIRSKYNCGQDLIPIIRAKKPGSRVWSGIKAVWENVKNEIEVVHRNEEYKVRWKLERSEMFSVRSAYTKVADFNAQEDQCWRNIWRLKVPQRCKMQMWFFMHDRLPTNERLLEWRIHPDGSCASCHSQLESTVHVIRECGNAKEVWLNLGISFANKEFWESNLHDWLRKNVKMRRGYGMDNWNEVFCVSCWLIWRRRNEVTHNNECSSVYEAIAEIKGIIRCMHRANSVLPNLRM